MAKNANPPSAGAFDRDFGYLMPFLDKVAAAATTLEDPGAREELSRLISEEKVRWQRVRELLAGVSGRAGAPMARPEPVRDGAPALARSSADNIHRVAPGAAGLTVGSLKGSR